MQYPLKDILIHITKKKVLLLVYYYCTTLMNNIKKTDYTKNVYTNTNILNFTQ